MTHSPANAGIVAPADPVAGKLRLHRLRQGFDVRRRGAALADIRREVLGDGG